jgi:hypothetical protein
VSADFDTYCEVPAPRRYDLLPNYQAPRLENFKTPVLYNGPSGCDGEEEYENSSGHDNTEEVFFEADSGIFNVPQSSKTASHNS